MERVERGEGRGRGRGRERGARGGSRPTPEEMARRWLPCLVRLTAKRERERERERSGRGRKSEREKAPRGEKAAVERRERERKQNIGASVPRFEKKERSSLLARAAPQRAQ